MNALAMSLPPTLRMRHFRTFLALCEQGSLTRAAEVLNTVQPALSRTLREMEEAIGVQLFVRSARGMTVTPEGEALRRSLTAGMAQIENGVAQAAGTRQSEVVALGVLPNVARELVPIAVQRFKRARPEVTVRLHTATVPELLDLLRKGRIDFLASRLVSIDQLTGVLFEHLYDEPLIFAVRPGHPILASNEVTLEQIARHLVMVPMPGTIIRQELDRFLFASGQAIFPNRIETVSYEFSRAFMQREDAVLFLPEGSLRKELREGRAVKLQIGGDDLLGAVGISYLVDSDLAPAAKSLVEELRTAVALLTEV